ncbi:MAG: hypothetical protein ACI8X5_000864 [Planctomycetota bacterium]|jgi:hypothetical protein
MASHAAALSAWIWLALWALPAGALAGSLGPSWLRYLPLAVACSLACFFANGLGTPFVGAIAICSLYLMGFALRGAVGALSWSVAAGILFCVGVLCALPSAGGTLREPFAPVLLATLLDLSPLIWVMESAGADWMRHPSVYEIAGSADLGPELRVAYSGSFGPISALFVALVCVLVRSRLGGQLEAGVAAPQQISQ